MVNLHSGFLAEEHKVTTHDGYHLKLHRLITNSSHLKSWSRPIVFLQHGMIASSDSYILVGPHHDLGKVFNSHKQ